MSDDYYKILEIERSSSPEAIKKAYRKLALKYHPDRNKESDTTEKFKTINEAYEALSDPKKKEIYDKFGKDGLRNSGNAHFTNPEDIFNMFFGNGSPFGGGSPFDDLGGIFGGGGNNPFNFFMHTNQRQQKAKDIVMHIKASHKDIYCGKKMQQKIKIDVICSSCKGSGLKPNCNKSDCSHCNGQGRTQRRTNMGIAITTCGHCNATGKIIKNNDKCIKCSGTKYIAEEKVFDINIEKGMQYGHQFIFKNKGNHIIDGAQGHVAFILTDEDYSGFILNNNDLIINRTISLTESLLGTTLIIKHLDDKEYAIKIKCIIMNEQRIRIKNLGMPIKNQPDKFGDLIIQIKINPPSQQFTQLQKDKLKKILPYVDKPEIKKSMKIIDA